MKPSAKPYMNPYIAGACLGLVLIASFLILGTGLGASSGIARIAAAIEGWLLPEHTANTQYFGAWGKDPLDYYLVYMFIGTMIGGLISAFGEKRLSFQLEKGRQCSSWKRMSLALSGGVLVGYASRLAQGCTSGQALTGGAVLLTGSFIFLICLFASGYATAYFVRRQWDD
ncbi:MAG: YeeE/YedE family protein [Proteobacteria bacterium]|nr:YeeE/YedE family protein [Pseudomonadota bacterium]MBU1582142.1 YeeE/YedE family protein [Pseudomonadota bacterium]MBU2631756.1 YeeE/YedE family protein [Pseudomonadota bacterium]